jgi:hypothetical protein
VEPPTHLVLGKLEIEIEVGSRVLLHHAFRIACAARFTAARIRG